MMMKRIGLLGLLMSAITFSCPTCVGRVEIDSPPFFSDDFYKPEPQTQNNDDLIQTVSEEEEE